MFLRRIIHALFYGDSQDSSTSNGRGGRKQSPQKSIFSQGFDTPYSANKTPCKRKKDRIPKHVRDNVWIKYNGNGSRGICYACGTKVNRYNAGWHCSHVISDSKGGEETVENLRTCCRHCNLSMGDQNLYAYIRDKGLTGPGSRNVKSYLNRHPSQKFDKRTNNWGKKTRL